MYSSFTASAHFPHPWNKSAMPPNLAIHHAPLLILGNTSLLIDTLQARLQEAYPASPLVRTTWIGDALERMAAMAAPLVFLSATLPDGQAFQCARAIKARWPVTRTILFGERRLSLAELLQAEVLDACLVAPITQTQLRLVLEAVLAWSPIHT